MLYHVYAVKHKDIGIREASRSGGIFTAVSDYILSKGGVVYGCEMKDATHAVHSRAERKIERDQFRGSKYVQSDCENIYSLIKTDLMDDRFVLVSGTPCQINAVKSYLNFKRVSTERLLLVDIVCHGVPSPAIWQDYVSWCEKNAKDDIMSVDFRDKSFGWNTHFETLKFSKFQKSNDIYTTMFYGHNILRPSCSCCPFTDTERISDITIADFWGVDKVFPDFDDNKGVSLVLVNSRKGNEIINEIKGVLHYCETQIENCMQPPLEKPFNMPEDRSEFWKDYKSKEMEYLTRKYGGNNVKRKIGKKWRRIKRYIKMALRREQG